MIEISLAQAVVNLVLGKTVEGALSAIGGDAYKAALEKLKGFLAWKFGGQPELSQASQNPDALTGVIEKSIAQDMNLKQELEKLVNELQRTISNAPEGKITMGDHGSLVTFESANISGGQAAGRDAIGGDQTKNYFR